MRVREIGELQDFINITYCFLLDINRQHRRRDKLKIAQPAKDNEKRERGRVKMGIAHGLFRATTSMRQN